MSDTFGPQLSTDVLIVGGGLGGLAAALSVCTAGRRAILVEQLPIVGGQVTAQLTSPLDEHPKIESEGAAVHYRRFRELVRARYAEENPGDGWVSRLCFEPLVGLEVLCDMLAPHIESGLLRLVTGFEACAVMSSNTDAVSAESAAGIRLQSITFRRVADPCLENPDVARFVAVRPHARLETEIQGDEFSVGASQFIDATELGDLLPLSGAPWVIGSEGQDAYGETQALTGVDRLAEQSCTVVAAVVLDADARADSDSAADAPANYEMWRDTQPFSLSLLQPDGTSLRFPMFDSVPSGSDETVSERGFWSYRRVRCVPTEAAIINWEGNDYDRTGLVAGGQYTVSQARELTRAFIHWLRTEAPRDGGGYGYPELRLAPEISGTADGLALAPYVRESRRLRVARPVSSHDLAPARGSDYPNPMDDSLGVAWYHADLHHRVGLRQSVYAPTGPFQIPARAFVGSECVNLIMGAKNIGATQIAAAAYRVHAGEWAVGEAAGHLALTATDSGVTPFEVTKRPDLLLAVQRSLVESGTPIRWKDAPASVATRDAGVLLDTLRGALVVSCQAQRHEELHGAHHMVAMARSVVRGGAGAVRAEGPSDIRAIREAVDVPIIGLWKLGSQGVFITPTLESAREVAESGADIVALDCTLRPRPDGGSYRETIEFLHGLGVLVMADISTLEEGIQAVAWGADVVSTTLSGYTPYSRQSREPDLELVSELAHEVRVPIFAEGRISSPEQAQEALERGAHCVVVGGAITRPADITAKFADAVGRFSSTVGSGIGFAR